MALPLQASTASRLRFGLAQELARSCPPALGTDIAVTGSVALGIADDDSDVELNCWVDELPSAEERMAWIEQVGGQDTILEPEPWGGGTFAATFRYQGVWVEMAWMTTASVEARLRPLLDRGASGQGRLVLAWVLAHAVPLRNAGLLVSWQQALTVYPDWLRERVIEAGCGSFHNVQRMAARWTFCRRRQPLALMERLTTDVHAVLRLLFALNRRWEPDYKWLRQVTRDLGIAPDRLAGRIEEIFTAQELEQRVATSLGLIRDTLALLPSTSGVELARRTIEECLRLGLDQAR